ncbi:MAG: ABC transporter permease subunit [Candidatus Bathyarchaeia archaeon]
MEKRKGKPFIEILATSIHEDYRFPILEVFAFLYAISTFVMQTTGGAFFYGMSAANEEAMAYQLVSVQAGTPLFIFLILIFKNVVYGFGSEFEKGTIQTLLSYPIKRHKIMTAKLLSATGISLAIFLGIQILSLFLMAPQTISKYITTVIIAYAAFLSYPLLITAILLLLTMKVRKGGLALVFGIVLYFALSMVSGTFTVLAIFTQNAAPLKALAVLEPSIAVQFYYTPLTGLQGGAIWTPCFNDVLMYLAGGYCLVIAAYAAAYYYFSRRLNI